MGIRVHKVVGYGLTDLTFEEDEKRYSKTMTDPRIDWKRIRKKSERMWETGPRSFMMWMKRHWETILQLEAEERRVPLEKVKEFSLICPILLKDFFKRHKSWNLGNCVVHEDEFGLPNVMVFIPPSQAHHGSGGWKRHDDTIDWIEESHVHQARARMMELPCCGIYPHDHLMVRFRDPKPGLWQPGERAGISGLKLDADGLPTAMASGDYNMLVGRWDPGKIEPMAKGELLEHLRNDWRPTLPSELMAVLLWLKDCFNDFEAIRNSLRPLLYVYWS
jgi:hypothetical protein